ncbi:sigma-54-dependent Fis family transcriptional regulator [Saccharobesus litoralis]|uniref:Sigma-54-dependent Fis family transcriptional regulator n=1 Tax=Saccharobesus litoralis TaxID=2172099 RepID=A0A2S0VQW5_9ALTE|nr:sigma-54 dependent transcriptional regulator [Saccharobesus litoralis]AWB66589.1 sigma-54-dependent Fis family transcriptional regulator [Saccharobesus litoralis]
MTKDKILIVDDNPDVCQALDLLLDIHGYQTVICSNPADAVKAVMFQSISLVIQDMNFSQDTTSGIEGRELFYQLRDLNPDLPIILITAWAQLETAVELVKDGAADYLSKPWDDSKLLTSIKNLLEMLELRQQNQQLHQQLTSTSSNTHSDQPNLCGLIFASQVMRNLVDMAVQVAKADIPVLITGANGAGKEKIAEIVQANSQRASQPFVKVNVGALPIDLMEAELFGAEPGAYTGLTKKRVGRFTAADGGTLFLDEIGNLPLSGQVKLLRVLQTGEFEPLGSHQTQKVNVRIISATNADLKQDIQQGKFREDLYYRLNVIELNVAELKQRQADIIPLAEAFIGEQKQLSSQAKQALEQHDWPGNVRELQNTCQRAMILSQSETLQAQDFGLTLNAEGEQQKPSAANDIDPQSIQQAIDNAQGNISRAAKSLGLSRQALYRRISKYKLTVEDSK